MGLTLAISCLLWAAPSPALPPDARTIQAAIDAAEPGSTLRLPAGVIKGRLRVDKPLTLLGAGTDKTRYELPGNRAGLLLSAKGGQLLIEDVGFFAPKGNGSGLGSGVLIAGPGQVTLRNVDLIRTMTGRCLTSALSLSGEVELFLEHVRIEGHRCYVAGAFVVAPNMRVSMKDSAIVDNEGQLAGAILMAGGQLRAEGTRLTANRFAREQDGHHLVVSSSEAELELVAVRFETDENRSVRVEPGVQPFIRIDRMSWPEADLPPGLVRGR